MNPYLENLRDTTRRHFLGQVEVGVGAIALACMLGENTPHADAAPAGPSRRLQPLAVRKPHFAAKAKSVIYLHMAGSPPQQELFDYKPTLIKFNNKPCPKEFLRGERFAFIKGTPMLLGTPYKFAKHGQSGTELSELLPNIAGVVDDITLIKSVRTTQFNHAPAQMFMHTGNANFGAASMGSWVTYGLGSENQDLPGFVVLVSGGKVPSSGKSVWGSGFLPSVYQGVQCRSSGDPVLYVSNPKGMDGKGRRRTLDAIGDLNRIKMRETGDPETLTRIAQYEMAYRMQASVPEAMDIKKEPKKIQEMYGAKPGTTSFANNCLLARRMVERGVRFVQLFDWGWDNHGTGKHDDIMHQLPKKCKETEGPIAALIRDLKDRGLFDETLIVWSGEFGRTPMNEKRNNSKFLGRDHHPHCFTVMMAGGGVKGGMTYGETDDLGYFATEGKVHVHDLQATILHLLGIDHERLTFKHLGLDQRLTTVTRKSQAVKQILA